MIFTSVALVSLVSVAAATSPEDAPSRRYLRSRSSRGLRPNLIDAFPKAGTGPNIPGSGTVPNQGQGQSNDLMQVGFLDVTRTRSVPAESDPESEKDAKNGKNGKKDKKKGKDKGEDEEPNDDKKKKDEEPKKKGKDDKKKGKDDKKKDEDEELPKNKRNFVVSNDGNNDLLVSNDLLDIIPVGDDIADVHHLCETCGDDDIDVMTNAHHLCETCDDDEDDDDDYDDRLEELHHLCVTC